MFRKLLSLLSDAAVYGVSSALSQIIGFVLLPLYTRYLTPAEQGLATMVVLITAFFTPLGNLGMISAIFRRFNLEKQPAERARVLSTGLLSVTVTSLALLAILLVAAPWISRQAVGDESATNLFRVSLLGAACYTIGMVPLAVLRAERRVKTIAGINVCKLLLSVAVTIWLVVVSDWGVWGVVAGSFVGEVVIACVLFVITFSSFSHGARLEVWRKLASYGYPLVPHQLQTLTLSLFAPIAVGYLLDLRELGLYSIAIKVAMPIAFLVNSVQTAWLAFKFQIHAEDEDPAGFFRTAFTYYIAGVAYLWVGVALWGPEVLWLLADESYWSAAWLVPLAALVPLCQGIYYMMSTGMEVSDNTRPFPLISLAGLAVAFSLIGLLVPALGAKGAPLASAAASLSMASVMYYFSQRRFRIEYDWSTLVAILLLALGAGAVGYWALALPVVPRLALSVAISLAFPLIEFAVLLRSSSERDRMRILWTQVARVRRSGSRGQRTEEAPANVEEVAAEQAAART